MMNDLNNNKPSHHHGIQSLPEDMVVTSVVSSTSLVFNRYAGIEVTFSRFFPSTNALPYGDYSAVIDIYSSTKAGSFVLSIPTPLIDTISERVFQKKAQDLSADMKADCVGEFLNIISSQLKSTLHEMGFPKYTLSPPQLFYGDEINEVVPFLSKPYVSLLLEACEQEFLLQISTVTEFDTQDHFQEERISV